MKGIARAVRGQENCSRSQSLTVEKIPVQLTQQQSLIGFLTKESNFDYRHFFCHIAAESGLASCNWWRKQGNFQSQVTVNFLTCSGWDLNPGSGERQLAWQCLCRGLVVSMPGSQA